MPAAWVGAGAAVVSAGSGIASAAGGSGAQSSITAAGQAAANKALQTGLTDYTTNATPYISTGANALSSLADATGLNGAAGSLNALSSFQASPGVAYQEQQGLSAIDNGAASTGTLRGGNTIRAEQTLGDNLANQDFSQYVNRLSGMANSGLAATNALGSGQLSTASGIASTDTSGAAAQANAAGNLAKGVGSALTGLANNSSVQDTLSKLTAPATTQVPVTTPNALASLGGAGSFNLSSST